MSSIEDSLPAIGGEYPFTKYASKVKLRVNVIGELELEFKGGIKFYVAKNLERGLGGRMLTVRGYEVSADSSEIGKITISQSDIDTTPPSLLEVTDLLPIFCETMILDFTMTVEKPPGGGPPMQLSNSKPMKLVSNYLTEFPHQGAPFTLVEPVDLAPVGSPEQIVATITEFPVMVTFGG